MALQDYTPPESDHDKALSEEELQSIVGMEIDNAVNFIETDIAPLRTLATQYFRGQVPDLADQEGRSTVTSRDVHDTIMSQLPSLMRVFFGPERIVEFVPGTEQDVEMAEQATDYVNYIFSRDNPGFLILYAALKDALTRYCGIVKYHWDDSLEVVVSSYSGLDIMQMLKMEQDYQSQGAEVELLNAEMLPNGTANVRLKVKKPRDRVKIAAIPPEEWFINSQARGLDDGDFKICGHRRELPKSDLIAMGYTEDEIEDCLGESDLRYNQEAVARRLNNNVGMDDDLFDEASHTITYVEAYGYFDTDGDGLAELHKFCCAGPANKILKRDGKLCDELVDSHPFAEFPCDPEPHTFFGNCTAADVMDVQKTKSGVLRATLDALALNVFPRTVVVNGAVEMADVLNTELGAIIRADRIDAVQELPTSPIGKDTYPMLAYMDEVRENRTGMSKVAQGLDPGALQNTTALAAANQFGKAHEHIEIIARVIAETGMKRLFRGILRLVTQNQRQARMVDLRGKFVQVDPRAYKADMEVTTNVALGGGTNREKIGALMQIKATQEQIILTGGPNNPLVPIKNYYNTLSKLTAMAGFKNVSAFFTDPSTMQAMPQAPPPPDPKAMAEMAKQQNMAKEIALKGIMHQNDMAQRTADRNTDAMLKIYDINVKNKTQHDVASIKALAETMRASVDLKLQSLDHEHDHAVIAHEAKVAPKPASPNAGH